MRKNYFNKSLFRVLFCLSFLAVPAAFFLFTPEYFRSSAGKKNAASESAVNRESFENYDIRTDKRAFEKVARFRAGQGKAAAEVADVRDESVRGEEDLKSRVPSLNVLYNRTLRAPELIAPDVKQGRAFLTESSTGKGSEIVRRFAKENRRLFGATDTQLDELEVVADYTNPDGRLSYTRLKQTVNNIPVFQAELKAGLTKDGRIIRVINNLAPGLDYKTLSADFRSPLDAVRSAAGYINHDLNETDLIANEAESNNETVKFGKGDWATTAEKIYFPTEPGVAVPAWRVLIWEPKDAFYVIVDAETGTMLWRKNITEDQSQAATYSVYANPNSMINVADNPAPMTPGPVSPTTGTQGTLTNRASVSLVGNEPPYSFNNLGWITDGISVTDGNNVEAGLDRTDPDGIDAPTAGSSFRNFTFNYTPPTGNPSTGDNPLTAESQKGGVTQLFYIVNRYHDEMYRLGFTEQAGNFQNSNFGRGGAGSDRVSAQSQDIFCTPPGAPTATCANNANFGTPADGYRGRMQMFMWTNTSPNRDGALDGDVILHELTHGLSNRLHNDASGLISNMARGMGEGWSDFYSHALLSEPTDPINGIYTTGGYITIQNGFSGNYYYGIRRFPKAVMSFTGGPNNRPHNPLTFADIDSTQADISDGAFQRGPYGSSFFDNVHNVGEVWSSALWEVRARFIARLGWEVGNRRILQYVTDGMKLSPSTPTFIESRDGIIAAAQSSLTTPQANADVADIWEGFRIRGIGFKAAVLNTGSGSNDTRVIESFDAPNLIQIPNFTFSDASGDNDGYAEPGETISLTIPLLNNTGTNAENTLLQVSGGGTANYGTVVNNTSATRTVNYTVPAGTACGGALTLTFQISNSLGTTTVTRNLLIGVPSVTMSENFDGVSAPQLPAGWTATAINGGVNFVTSTNNSDTAPNSAFALDPLTVGGGTDLTSPSISIVSANAIVSFRNRYDTEANWDGGVLEISVDNGAFQDILAAGGAFLQNGYNGTLGGGSTNTNPVKSRAAWTGNSGGYITTLVQLPASAAGKQIKLRWRFGADDNTAELGWNIDTVQVFGNYSCSFVSQTVKSRADFDGDGKTDLSVFRASDGNWYLNRSTAGFTAVRFGAEGDKPVPGDYDGDGKTDVAVKRQENWYILNSSTGTFYGVSWGASTDIPAAGDYNGDGKTDTAVFRPSDGTWYILYAGGGTQFTQFGANGDKPVPGDYDGDGKTDVAVYRAGTWYLMRSSTGFLGVAFGDGADNPVPADYDGDNRDDIAVYRPSNGEWYRLNSSNGQFFGVRFGAVGDIPVPGDYDGDGRDDVAVYRAGTWYLLQSGSGFSGAAFGAASDNPIPKSYIP